MPRLMTSLLVFTLFTILLGSWVRNAAAGLSCPDWPLCHGQWIPPMEYRIMLEYFHRLAASIVGFILIAAMIRSLYTKEFRKPIAPWILSAFFLLGIQINLGKLTVTELLAPHIVSMHLGTAVIIFALLLIATQRAFHLESGNRLGTSIQTGKGFKWAAWLAIVVLYVQVMLGGSVSSNYAGLACPDFPTCNGLWFPGFSGRVGLQFIHRCGAVFATLTLLYFMYQWKPITASMRASNLYEKLPVYWSRFPCFIGAFLVIQWLLGVGMIFWGANESMKIPSPLSVAHLGIGLALISMIVSAYVEFRPEHK